MSTSCGIAFSLGETYQTIYCNNSGYPAYMLPMLSQNYNSIELVSKLVSFGDASYIGKKLEPTSNFHKFETPEADVCVFYHRDRGESWESCRSVCYTASELFRQTTFDWVYIFEHGQWNVYKNGKKCFEYDSLRRQ